MNKPTFCVHCGALLESPDDLFCGECGQPAQPVAASDPQERSPQPAPQPSLQSPPMQPRTQSRRLLPKSVLFALAGGIILLLAILAVKAIFFKGHAITTPVVFADGQVFYINTRDDMQIYKMDPDGSDKTVFDDSTAFVLATDGEWLYFGGLELYKIRPDGTGKTLLASLWLDELAAGDGWLYTVAGQSGEPGITRISMDGQTRETLANVQATNLVLAGDTLFFRNVDDAYSLWSVRTDGSGARQVVADPVDYTGFAVLGDWIYYTNGDDSSCIYKVRADGSGRVKIGDDYAAYLTAEGDWLYYANADDNWALYRIRTDGSGRERLVNQHAIHIRSDGDYTYFALADKDDRLSQVENPD